MKVIQARNLTKIYRGRGRSLKAIDRISFEIKKGEIFGIVGPTGAGKTTTIKILSTLIIPDEGNAIIDGYDILNDRDKIRKRIGVVAGEFTRALYWRLTGRGNLEFFAKIRGVKDYENRINYLLDLFNLKEYENELLMKYSTGMKHKIALAVALLNDPPILFLDEPLTGIDPVTSYEIKELIKKEFRDKTIIWTSHNLYEIEEMCHRVLILNRGRKVLEGKVDELKNKYWNYKKIIIECSDPSLLADEIGGEIVNERVEIKAENVGEMLNEIVEIAREKKIELQGISTAKPSLEDIFMMVIKNDRGN
ncbi:MAG: ABC transporter ATP-binding protein [Thermoplasmata archaeon]|nr:ABC transporter ATP-binding protein [Thermoplasmata archaeon]